MEKSGFLYERKWLTVCFCDSEASSVSVLSAERRYCQRIDTPNRSLASGANASDVITCK